MNDTSYILTYRGVDSDERRDNLAAVLRSLERWPALEVIVFEQDSVPRAGVPPSRHAKWLFGHNAGPFNKSWGFNADYAITFDCVVRRFSPSRWPAPEYADRAVAAR